MNHAEFRINSSKINRKTHQMIYSHLTLKTRIRYTERMKITSEEIINLIRTSAPLKTDVFLELRNMPRAADFTAFAKALKARVLVLLPGRVYAPQSPDAVLHVSADTYHAAQTGYMDIRELMNDDAAEWIRRMRFTELVLPFYECADITEYGYKTAYMAVSDLRAALPFPVHITAVSRGDHLGPRVFEPLGTTDYVLAGVDVSNRIAGCRASDERDALYLTADQCAKYPLKTVIVQCTTRAGAETLHAFLQRRNVNAALFHGGITPERNDRALADFTGGRTNLLISTKSLISSYPFVQADKVVYYGLPYSLSHAMRCASLSADGRLTCIWCGADIDRSRTLTASFLQTLGMNDAQIAAEKEDMLRRFLTQLRDF